MGGTILVTLLTGFLGAGKTTLLNHLIQARPMTAVIMNEFGEIGLDHQLVEGLGGPMALLSGGCVCCQVQGDLAPTLKNLHMGREDRTLPPYERVIIETTGIADPAPILNTLLYDRWIAARHRMDGVITMVDGQLGADQLANYPEAARQAAMADRLLIGKTDLADAETLDRLREKLRALNPAAEMRDAPHGRVDPAWLLDVGAYRPEDKHPDVLKWLAHGRFQPAALRPAGLGARRAASMPAHGGRLRSFSLRFEEALDETGVAAALDLLLKYRAANLLRMKALVNMIGRERPVVLHAVQHVLYPPAELPVWPDADRGSRFVFITDGLEPDFVRELLADFSLAARHGQTEGMHQSQSRRLAWN